MEEETEIITIPASVNEVYTNMEETGIVTTMLKTTEPTPWQDANATKAEAGMPADANKNRWMERRTKRQQWRNRISTI